MTLILIGCSKFLEINKSNKISNHPPLNKNPNLEYKIPK